MGAIRRCGDKDISAILSVINSAAGAYRGVIPADCWHEPYMSLVALESEIAAGVAFWAFEADRYISGVMASQAVRDVHLIRHAYVLPGQQRHGVGGALIQHLRRRVPGRMLVGTWAAASWAIRFYERHGFELAPPEQKTALLQAYWSIPDRQIETSVVLADPPIR